MLRSKDGILKRDPDWGVVGSIKLQRSKRRRMTIIVLLIGGVLLGRKLFNNSNYGLWTNSSGLRLMPEGHSSSSSLDAIPLLRLDHEAQFTATLKKCLPQVTPKKCKTFVPETESKRSRVVLLAPPGKMSQFFGRLVEAVVVHRQQEDNIEVVLTTHMAPYGYGKTHGYTRIIRIVPVPLLVGVADTLSTSQQSITATASSSKEQLSQHLRQQIRYHCRLNHNAAHTALWTISFDEFQSQPSLKEWVHQIEIFLGLSEAISAAQQQPLSSALLNTIFGMDDTNSTDGDKLLQRQIENIYANSQAFLSHASSNEKQQKEWKQQLDKVLLDELHISKDLSAWPCESFWTVGDRDHKDKKKNAALLPLDPTLQSIAKAMSPNCTAPLTTCFVKKDKCEAQGNGLCS